LAPPELLFVTGERTNVARIRVKMERIPNSAAYAISHAEINSEMTGFNFQVNEVLQIFDSIITGSLQPKLNARLRVTEVNAQSGIARVEIIQGGRYVLMPPRHINLHAPDGTPLRMEIQTRRIPKHAELSEAILARDRKFWNEYSKRLIGDAISADMSVKAICQWIEKTHLRRDLTGYNGDPRFLRDQQAQKGFSKLRGSIGNIYAWRMRLSPAGSELRKRYAREAEHAYRQAFAFGPISPEAVIRYTALLGELGRYRDAVEVALTFQKLDPLFPQTNQMIAQALEAEIAIHAAAHEMDKALEAAQLLHQLVASPRYANLVKSLEDALKARQIYLNRFQRDPANVEYFNTAVDVTVQSHQLNTLRSLIDLFQTKMTRNERNLAALARAYNYLEDYANKEKVYLEMTALIPNDPVPWYDLAKAQMRLKKTNAAATSLQQSLTLYSKAGATNLYDIPAFTRTNAIMAPLRERPEIQKLLKPEKD
jgi:tetratricopeptide (TPR) repeat protein